MDREAAREELEKALARLSFVTTALNASLNLSSDGPFDQQATYGLHQILRDIEDRLLSVDAFLAKTP